MTEKRDDKAKDAKAETKAEKKDSKQVGNKFEDLDKPAEAAVYPEPSGTDSGAAGSAIAAPAGSSGATTSSMMQAGGEHDIDDKNFDKETGFWTEGEADKPKGKSGK